MHVLLGLRDNHILIVEAIMKYIIAILLENKFIDNKEQARLEMHYYQEHTLKEIDIFLTLKMSKVSTKST